MGATRSVEETRKPIRSAGDRAKPPRTAASALWKRLTAPVDISSLVCFRVAFGALMLWEVARYLQYGWVGDYYIERDIHFTYYGFGWVQPWPPFFMHLHFYLMGACALFILLGLYYRAATILFFLSFTYVFLLDQTEYLNHFYLISLVSLLMIFVPAHRAFSMDALKGRVRLSSKAPSWSLGILRFQFAVVYVYGGMSKLYQDWLVHSEPMRTWLSFCDEYPLIGPYVREEWFIDLFSYGGLVFDLAIVPLLIWKRTRLAAFLAAVAFHVLNAWLFTIGIFPWFMIVSTLLFFPPDWPRRVGFGRLLPDESATDDESVVSTPLERRAIVPLLAVYCAVQLLVPLRPYLYPGNCRWTEEGRRFSWHMKNRDKFGWAEFHVTVPQRSDSWFIQPDVYLTERQAMKMSIRPDLILQFSHYLADEFRRDGHKEVEVRANVWVALNGRQEQQLIDPAVDLASVPRSLGPADWILPLSE